MRSEQNCRRLSRNQVGRGSSKKLINKKNIKWLDDAGIKGITGTEKQLGQPKLPVQSFKRILNW